jgi:hypothetical protein
MSETVTPHKIRQAWTKFKPLQGGENAYAAVEIEQGSGFYKLQGRGVCFAFVRFWLAKRNGGLDGWDLANVIRENWDSIVKKQHEHDFSTGWASAEMNQVEDDGQAMGMTIKTRYMKGASGNAVLNRGGNEGLLDEIFGAPGLYALTVGGKTGPGHALGFDTRGDVIYFLDPNLGQIWCEGGGQTARGDFRGWYRQTFWPGMGYKAEYAKGRRVLVQYDPKNAGQVTGSIAVKKKLSCTIL